MHREIYLIKVQAAGFIDFSLNISSDLVTFSKIEFSFSLNFGAI